MKQQTAVEWLEERFDKYMAWRTGDHKATEYTYQELVNDFDKARQMEKEQAIQFHIECMKAGLIVEGERKWDEDYEPIVKSIAEKHYSETYENPNT